jgi:hypothetical protein
MASLQSFMPLLFWVGDIKNVYGVPATRERGAMSQVGSFVKKCYIFQKKKKK